MSDPVFTAPYYDVVFKAIFGNENNKRPLMSLLSSILDLPIENFEALDILNGELLVDHVSQKSSRLDLRIRLKDGIIIDVELQVVDHIAYKERILYYWSKLYHAAHTKGELFSKLKKCVVINIVYFNLFDTPRMHTRFKVLELLEHFAFTEHLEFHVLELSKLNAYNKGIENDLLLNWAE